MTPFDRGLDLEAYLATRSASKSASTGGWSKAGARYAGWQGSQDHGSADALRATGPRDSALAYRPTRHRQWEYDAGA